jgi:cell wall-associated NlpC family hydrolase
MDKFLPLAGMRIIVAILCLLSTPACSNSEDVLPKETVQTVLAKPNPPLSNPVVQEIHTGSTKPEDLLAFAKLLIGVPYHYGSTDPVNGFDCSGFITYVFNHFNISVPRSSIDFTHYGTNVELAECKPGDIILFTGTDSTIREVGHMGIISTNGNNQIEFIHSSSGKAHGVTITPLNSYYMGRFVKVIRVFGQ